MSTFLPKAEDIKREWYVLDAANKPLGRTAALAATLLRGKQMCIRDSPFQYRHHRPA